MPPSQSRLPPSHLAGATTGWTNGKILAIFSLFIVGAMIGTAHSFFSSKSNGSSSFHSVRGGRSVADLKAPGVNHDDGHHLPVKTESQRHVNEGHNAFADHAHEKHDEGSNHGDHEDKEEGKKHREQEDAKEEDHNDGKTNEDAHGPNAKATDRVDERQTSGDDDAEKDGGNAKSEGKFRGVECPASSQEEIDKNLQIPLKHLPRKKPTSVREKYDRRAHNCAGHGIWNRVTIEDHHKILHNMVRMGGIKRGAFIFDWGAGCGHSMMWLHKEYQVRGVGIDVSGKTIAYARANTTSQNLYCVADGTKLDFIPSNTFDNAISFGSVYHVYNRTVFCHVLRQMARIVKVGGTVYNGWTENAEYKRQHVKMCFDDLPVTPKVLEEKVEMADVKIYPLKPQQLEINAYSLVVTKNEDFKSGAVTENLDTCPIWCDTHRCFPRDEFVPSPAPPKKRKRQEDLDPVKAEKGVEKPDQEQQQTKRVRRKRRAPKQEE